MTRKAAFEQMPALSWHEQSRDDALRRYVDSGDLGSRRLGAVAFCADGDRAAFGVANLVDARSSCAIIAPVPASDDRGKIVTIVRAMGAATITVVLSGATVDGASTFSLSSSDYSAILMAVGQLAWVQL